MGGTVWKVAIGRYPMNSFKDAQFPKDVIRFAINFYVRYAVFYRDLKEIKAERSVTVDDASHPPMACETFALDRQ
jgi:hypothetical protein